MPRAITSFNVVAGERNQIAIHYEESDGDSIYASLIPTRMNAITPMVYAASYSATSPIQTDTAHPFYMDDKYLYFDISPTLQEVGLLTYKVANYMIDPVTNQSYCVGYVTGDILIQSVSLFQSYPPINVIGSAVIDSLNQLQVMLDKGVYASSVSDNFSEMEVHSANGVLQPNFFTDFQPDPDHLSLSDTMRFTYNPAMIAGPYQLTIAKGVDSTTFMGQCARSVAPDTISFMVPLVPCQVLGPDSVYLNGLYSLSDPNGIDSVEWRTNSGIINYQGQSHMTPVMAVPGDSISIAFSTVLDTVIAIRYGNTVSDTLMMPVTVFGFDLAETDIKEVVIYPNPAKNHFHVVLHNMYIEDPYQIMITDAMGRVVYQEQIIDQSTRIDCANWSSAGMFNVQVMNHRGEIIDRDYVIIH